ncbi:MAG: hypothetical protein RLZZ630_239 [Bacteroidota bacterium]
MGRCRSIWIISVFFVMLSQSVGAQVLDDFNDGDFIQGTPWTGDSLQFIVDNGELRLFSTGSDSSSLVTLFQSGIDTLEWRFRLRMPFAPSSQNYVRYYLWVDAADLEGPLNGFYLQFGETGSADAFELRVQNGFTGAVLLRGPDSLVANGVDLRMKVIRFPGGFWQVWYGSGSGGQLISAGTAFHSAAPAGAILGWKCVYTSSNAQKSFLDDVYAGPYQYDREPPQLISAAIAGTSSLEILWNEPLDTLTALDPFRYWMSPFGVPDSIKSLTQDGRRFILHLSGPFVDTISYLLQISGIQDESGNAISDTLNWSVYKVFSVEPGQVVFSEIMANPSGAPSLPQYEYVELYNRSARVLTLEGCYFHDASSSCPLTNDTLKPGEYVVYTSNAAAEAFSSAGYGRCSGISCFPSLNNDGDSLRLTGPADELIDAIYYDNGMYVDPLRDDQGWSLERIDVSSACSSRENWKACIDPSGGTPGLSNSEPGLFSDTVAPRAVHAYPVDSMTTLLYFSEWPDTTIAKDPQLYQLDPVGWTAASVRIGKGKPHMEIEWPMPMGWGVNYELEISAQLNDCSGNILVGCNRIPLGLPMAVRNGDVLVNEVLFNPLEDDGDFVEIVNRSAHPVDCNDLRLAYADPADGIVKGAVGLQTESRLIMPGDYLVAALAPERIVQRYPNNGKFNLVRTELSGYDDDEGVVVLLDASLRVLDRFQYSDDFHFPLLADPEGVSLERIRREGLTDDKQNWHSASFQSGYATPGLKNSQEKDSVEDGSGWFNLEPRLFTPDNDGHHDVLFMYAHLSKPGFMAAVHLYDEFGSRVCQIAANEYLGTEASWSWNGTNDDGELMPPGAYIVSVRFVHIDGEIRRIRKPCVLAPGRMDN